MNIAQAASALESISERQRDCNARDKEEERKHKISRRPSVPLRVFQRPVDMLPTAWVINDGHSSDGHTPKHIQRNNSILCNRHRRALRFLDSVGAALFRSFNHCTSTQALRIRQDQFVNVVPTNMPRYTVGSQAYRTSCRTRTLTETSVFPPYS